MGARCSCDSLTDARKQLSPQEEVDTFKKFYKDVMLQQLRKEGKKDNLEHTFGLLGGENDSVVTREEMIRYLKRHKYSGNGNTLFDLIDLDNEGRISKEEFASLTKVDFLKHGPIRMFKSWLHQAYTSSDEAWKAIDVDHDHFITPAELEKVLRDIGYPGDAHVVFFCLDEDQDGFVTLSEFKHLMGRQSRKIS
eukprot:TRINITY_DN12203_c0_g1_i1.p1 TRINITY_DN12203_c0_g1~~TRINITY_DN12203_c0_g1_i1.p1  ORF type:complete len:194 (+),score=30.54 TRINITY_DN12203_c0_g1_i1:44-625(+)